MGSGLVEQNIKRRRPLTIFINIWQCLLVLFVIVTFLDKNNSPGEIELSKCSFEKVLSKQPLIVFKTSCFLHRGIKE
jgi:hypothetical protein